MRVAGRLREACLQKPLDAEGIRAALEEIASKNVRQDIMQRLGIAKLLKRLQRCSDADVAALAKVGRSVWVAAVPSSQPMHVVVAPHTIASSSCRTLWPGGRRHSQSPPSNRSLRSNEASGRKRYGEQPSASYPHPSCCASHPPLPRSAAFASALTWPPSLARRRPTPGTRRVRPSSVPSPLRPPLTPRRGM